MTIYDTHRKGLEESIAKLDAYLTEGAPSMDKFEKAGALNRFRDATTSQEISLLEAVIEMARGLLLENEKVEEEYGDRDETGYSSAIADLIFDLEDAIDQIKNDTRV